MPVLSLSQALSKLQSAANLDELLKTMNSIDGCLTVDDSKNLDLSALPTFGGMEPVNTWAVWSWDATRQIVGEYAPFKIEPRPVTVVDCVPAESTPAIGGWSAAIKEMSDGSFVAVAHNPNGYRTTNVTADEWNAMCRETNGLDNDDQRQMAAIAFATYRKWMPL